ncbi:ABC-type transport system ATP-binding protein (probable substrate branched-chain amino acids) [Natronomonas moolapensis 8.8.11]|uniref:Probable branched-chain amino acid transport ATP-binding protein LivG n=2 Tax=Natronomonas moolapensis TaxID=416273 RepID=M1XLI8_NATM8|nr:ABC-type transport system ATP-binding protein (probable substrate branched-chain amino acids) [Natronomonas moolapensis 8.8.11]
MLLETNGLTKRFGELTAVDEVDLQIEEGDSLSIIGPNGAGKSTTVNLITGLLNPTEGDVLYRGERITGQEPHEIVQQGLSKSFQTASIFPELTVERNAIVAALGAEHGSFSLNFFKRLTGYDEVAERARRTLEDMGLYEQRHIEAQSLPYGDKRRLEMALALASDPDLLFLDEPTAGMSPDETDDTVDLIERIKEERGVTIVLIEHDMEIIFRVSDRIAVLNRGAKIADGTPDDIRGDPDVQEAYLGGVEI